MQPISCLIKSPLPFGLAEFLNHRDARLAVRRRAGTRCAGVGAAVPRNPDWMSPPWRLGNMLAYVMRRHGDTCAPVRAALVQLRVANGVKWGRGREEVEAQERQKRCLSVPCSLEVVPSWGWEGAGGHRTTDFQVAPAQLEVRSAEPPEGGYPAVPSAGEMPVMPRTAWCARSSQGRQEAKQKPLRAQGLVGWGGEATRTGAPFVLRSLTSGKGQGTVNQ